MTTKISSKGQIVLPAELRKQDRIETGQEFVVERVDAGEYLLKRVPQQGVVGLVDWLESCPEKGWFERVPSELTDAIANPLL